MLDRSSTSPSPLADWRLQAPDAVLLRRFGYVRAVGAVAWTVLVVLLVAQYGTRALPLALGVPVLLIVTAIYFARSLRYPRTMVTVSLVADAIVLFSAIAFFGGTGSGLILVYAIVVVSAGLLLGPASAAGFTLVCLLLGFAQLGLEQLGLTPAVLHRPALLDRLLILAASGAGLVSVGYLSATYASRLHELIADAGLEAARVRDRGWRRSRYVDQAGAAVRDQLGELEGLASELERGDVDASRRGELAAQLRIGVGELEASVSELADVAALGGLRDARPQPVRLPPVVDDCRRALAERLADHVVTVDVPELRVVGDPRAARRVTYNLLENAADHTPPGTRVHIAARTGAGQGVLVVTDDGPGVPADHEATLFDPPDEREPETVGLPLVRELCEEMGARVHHERPPGGGARFVVSFRLAPAAAPSGDEPEPGRGAANRPTGLPGSTAPDR